MKKIHRGELEMMQQADISFDGENRVRYFTDNSYFAQIGTTIRE